MLLFGAATIYLLMLTICAVFPAIFLVKKISSKDRLEKESKKLLRRLVCSGMLSSILAIFLEYIGISALGIVFNKTSLIYQLLENYVVIALSEEFSKYFFLKRKTWNSDEFNCLYDGIVYASCVSLGFALAENISYVIAYGFSVAWIRAITAIPAHASFGIFMGIYYSEAKHTQYLAEEEESNRNKLLAILIPTLLHGTYDFVARSGNWRSFSIFVLFIAIMFTAAKRAVNRHAEQDAYIRLFDFRD